MHLEIYLEMSLEMYLNKCLEIYLDIDLKIDLYMYLGMFFEIYLGMCREMYLRLPGNTPHKYLGVNLNTSLEMHQERCAGFLCKSLCTCTPCDSWKPPPPPFEGRP